MMNAYLGLLIRSNRICIFVNILMRVQAEKTVTISCCYGYIKAIYRSLERFEKKTASGAATLDPNTANFLSEADFNIAVREIQSLVRYDEPPKKTLLTQALYSTPHLTNCLENWLQRTEQLEIKTKSCKQVPGHGFEKAWTKFVMLHRRGLIL
uniref:Uncharacterized protein n=1 Tax=Ditylenchus dipsaci TaxID=166011 RepID=A0A915DRU8_9BILA